MTIMQYIEQHLEERIDSAKKRALAVKTAASVQTVEEAELVLRMIISNHYKIPFFDEYFDKRTIDELFFEAELIALHSSSDEQNTSRTIKESKKEIAGLADEMEKELEDEWKAMESAEPLDPTQKGDPMLAMAKRFMETGSFIGEMGNDPREDKIANNEQQHNEKEEPSDDWK